eukprot:6021014-Pyramimonas_sp.AAC.1
MPQWCSLSELAFISKFKLQRHGHLSRLLILPESQGGALRAGASRSRAFPPAECHRSEQGRPRFTQIPRGPPRSWPMAWMISN